MRAHSICHRGRRGFGFGTYGLHINDVSAEFCNARGICERAGHGT